MLAYMLAPPLFHLALFVFKGSCNSPSFFKTGEIAKKANVSVRTIQYYDSIGLLHPSIVDEKGYRFFSEEDLIKLQKNTLLKVSWL